MARIVTDKIKRVEHIGTGMCIRVITRSSMPICCCGMIVDSKGMFLGNHVHIKDEWLPIHVAWEDGIYEGIMVYNTKKGVFEQDEIEFMEKIHGVKIFKIETKRGRCAVFSVRTSLMMNAGKFARMRKLDCGDTINCMIFGGRHDLG
tara:strand:+ start:392 stop:832 length:441 start_codon:yes stop_codon:yes gene_type:complete